MRKHPDRGESLGAGRGIYRDNENFVGQLIQLSSPVLKWRPGWVFDFYGRASSLALMLSLSALIGIDSLLVVSAGVSVSRGNDSWMTAY